MVSIGFPSKMAHAMILTELPVHDVIMYVNTRRSGTTAYFFNTSLTRSDD